MSRVTLKSLRRRVFKAARRRESWRQLAQFCVVGASGYAVNLCAFALTIGLVTRSHLLAATAAFLVAVINNFLWNRRFTFADSRGTLRRQAGRFFAVSVAAFVIAAAVLDFLVGEGTPALAAQAFSIAAVTPINFIVNRLWTFDRASSLVDVGQHHPPSNAPGTGAWLILPTYNEADNIERFLHSVMPHLSRAAAAHRVLIVDDSSPDGTGQIADRLARQLDSVEVLHRTRKEGLGPAYLAGFARALANGAELIIEMDSDFSHDPRDLPRLIAATRDADLAIGSRYVSGGGVKDWSLTRRLLSRGGSWYARTILGVPVRDLTGGFKCFRRPVIERVAGPDVKAAGYGFQIEMTYRALRAGYGVAEVPIVFQDRHAGASKMSARIALEALWQVPSLRLRPLRVAPAPHPNVRHEATRRFRSGAKGSEAEALRQVGSP